MRKTEQKEINAMVLGIVAKLQVELTDHYTTGKNLRYCQAKVLETDSFLVLQSYDTIIACIDITTGICFDFLRYVYGYTATSASHIAKFCNDYAATYKYTYKSV